MCMQVCGYAGKVTPVHASMQGSLEDEMMGWECLGQRTQTPGKAHLGPTPYKKIVLHDGTGLR